MDDLSHASQEMDGQSFTEVFVFISTQTEIFVTETV
jgi:hypothetical protein